MGAHYVTKRADDLEKPIVDADQPLIIGVTNLDVEKAHASNSKCCAFVRACERQVEKIQAAFFFRSVAYLEYDDRIVKYSLPPSIEKEIVSFDRTRKMMPGVYQLSKPYQPAAKIKADVAKRTKEQRPSHAAGGEGTSGRKNKSFKHPTAGIRQLSEPTYRAGKS